MKAMRVEEKYKSDKINPNKMMMNDDWQIGFDWGIVFRDLRP